MNQNLTENSKKHTRQENAKYNKELEFDQVKEENMDGTAFSIIRYHGGVTMFHDRKRKVPHLMLVSLLISNAS